MSLSSKPGVKPTGNFALSGMHRDRVSELNARECLLVQSQLGLGFLSESEHEQFALELGHQLGHDRGQLTDW